MRIEECGLWSVECGVWSVECVVDFFDFFQTVCFWKAETKLEMNLLNFLGSEVI